MQKISWDKSIWFSDIDDTLITTADSSQEASIGIEKVFTSRFGKETGIHIQREFMNIFNTMLDVHRVKEVTEEYKNLIRDIEDYQKDLPPEYGKPKLWSREIFISIAAKRIGLSISTELISEAADAYWLNLTQVATILPGVLQLISEIKKHNSHCT